MTATIDPTLLQRAMHPDLRVGRGILGRQGFLPGSGVLLTQEGPLAALGPRDASRFARVVLVDTLEADALERRASELAGFDWVAGLGGGMTMDAAKHVAWRNERPLVLMPGSVSVDASVTNTIAVRRGRGVVYEGFVVADRIVADLELIERAPDRVNRAGVGDLLSIQTGLHDWRRGAAAGRIGFDAAIADRSAAVLERLYGLADEIAAGSDTGLEAILRGYVEVNELCLRAGNSGPEEGSEHYLAYQVEALTGRSFVHGEIIGLGVVAMARLQENDPARAIAFLDRCGVAWRPGGGELALDRALLSEALGGLRDFVRSERLPWSVVDEADLGGGRVEALLDWLYAA